MYFALSNKEKKEKIFSKNEAIQEALEIIKNNYQNWTVLTNFDLCDIFLIKNFQVNVEEGVNTGAPQPFFRNKMHLFQRNVAINFLDKNEELPEETILKLSQITCANIITSNPQTIRKIIDDLLL